MQARGRPPSATSASHPTSNTSRTVLLGFPTDVNSSFQRGTAKAPALIRKALFSPHSNNFSERMTDVLSNKVLCERYSVNVALSESEADRELIQETVSKQLERGDRVLSIGGDHSITYPIIRGHASRFPRLSIVHIDAHPDMYPSFEGNAYSHACPFARILEDPVIGVDTLVQIGIRTMSPAQFKISQRFGVKVFGPDEVAQACAALPAGPVYVSIDLDGLDPAFAPGVSHPEPGGLSTRDVLRIIASIPGHVIGGDIVEYNPDNDLGQGLTAVLAAKLVKELLCRMTRDGAKAG